MKQTKRPQCLSGAIIGFGNMAERGHLPGWLKNLILTCMAKDSGKRFSRAEDIINEIDKHIRR